MNGAMRGILKFAGLGYVEFLLWLPVLLAAAVYFVPGGPPWIALLACPVLYGIGAAITYSIPKVLELGLYLCALVIPVLLGIMLCDFTWKAWILIAAGWVAVYRGARMATEPLHLYFSAEYCIVGLIQYFVASIVMGFLPRFEPYTGLVYWGGFLSLLLALMMINESNVKKATLSGSDNPALSSSVLWKNRLLIIGLFGLVLLLGVLGLFRQALGWLGMQLLGLLLSDGTYTQIERGIDARDERTGQFVPGGSLTDGSDGMDGLISVIVFVLLGIAVLLVIFLLLRLWFLWGKLIMAWLRDVFRFGDPAEASQGYEDEVERLINWNELGRRWTGRWRKEAFLKEHWDQYSDNGEKVRYLYRRLLRESIRHGYLFKAYLTPRETIDDLKRWNNDAVSSGKGSGQEMLAMLYERVRYGRKKVADRELEQVRAILDNGAENRRETAADSFDPS